MHECIQKKGHVVIENLLVSFRAHKAYPSLCYLTYVCMSFTMSYLTCSIHKMSLNTGVSSILLCSSRVKLKVASMDVDKGSVIGKNGPTSFMDGPLEVF